jgi:sialate O-acetylesterase
MNRIVFLSLLCFITFNIRGNVKLPAIFTDHMVLQQNEEILMWGWARPLENISITTSWNNKTYKDTTDHSGRWNISVTTPSYGGPYDISIQGHNKIVLNDVMIGEVWLVSGQSNMEWSVQNGIIDGENEAKLANYSNLRFFKTYTQASPYPQDDASGEWNVCTPESMASFSAIGYYFGRKIMTDLNIPVGIVSSSWGGTPAEAWTPSYAIKSDPVLYKNSIEKKQEPWGPKDAGAIYNAMIHPIKNTKIKGVLWYQGESNVSHGSDYDRLLSTMINSWRKEWNQDFPFYFAQIAPYTYGGISGVEVRDAQRRVSLSVPKTDMVVISDIGDVKDIHPKNKKDVGLRFANIALKNDYKKAIEYFSGPKISSHVFDKNKVTITFQTNGEIICNEACKKSFELGDVAGNMKKADVVIKGSTITLSAKGIAFPMKAQWNWCNTCSELLTDRSGLPSSSFYIENGF